VLNVSKYVNILITNVKKQHSSKFNVNIKFIRIKHRLVAS